MKIENNTKVTLTQEDVIDILKNHIARELECPHKDIDLDIDINLGDDGSSYPKESLDYSPHVPAHIAEVTATVKSSTSRTTGTLHMKRCRVICTVYLHRDLATQGR